MIVISVLPVLPGRDAEEPRHYPRPSSSSSFPPFGGKNGEGTGLVLPPPTHFIHRRRPTRLPDLARTKEALT